MGDARGGKGTEDLSRTRYHSIEIDWASGQPRWRCRIRPVMRQVLITGVTGQDGEHLSKLPLDNGYRVFGLDTDRAAQSHG